VLLYVYLGDYNSYRDHYRYSSKESETIMRVLEKDLERIRILNRMKQKSFFKNYFQKVNQYDFRSLLSLPISEKCRVDFQGINYKRFDLGLRARRRSHKGHKKANYKTGFPYRCSICKEEKSIKGYVMAIPDVYDMILMLKAIVADSEFNEGIDILEKIYGYLSAEFVHFATRALPDREPDPYEFGKQSRTIRLWGFEGVAFCLQILDLLTDYYYRKMR
jgi:hypothetical protein